LPSIDAASSMVFSAGLLETAGVPRRDAALIKVLVKVVPWHGAAHVMELLRDPVAGQP